MAWDQIGFELIHGLTGQPMIDTLMVMAAEYLVFLVPLTLMIYWFCGKEAKVTSLYVFTTAVTGIVLSYLAGVLYAHENPSAVYETIVAYEPENAFPSQHTVAIIATAFGFLWRENRPYGYTVLGAGVLTGFARIYIGEHWPIDIIGSFIVAGIAVGLVMVIEDRLDTPLTRLASIGQRVESRARDRLGV